MKNVRLTFLFAFFAMASFAQNQVKKNQDSTKINNDDTKGRNELNVNLLAIALGGGEISYERLLSKHSGLGASLFIGAAKLNEQFYFLPYYRFYFGERKARGFFVEASTGIVTTIASVSQKYIPGEGHVVFAENKGTSLGLATAIGYKLMSKNRFIGSIYLGAGRLLGKNAVDDYYHRIGFTLGKRF